MRFLLDTHVFIWFIAGDTKLPASLRGLIEDVENQRLLSVASLWEIAIKISLGKLEIGAPFEELIPGQLIANHIEMLPISTEHLQQITQLPFHHRDPFDRLLIAQSLTEKLPLLSLDHAFDAYSIQRIGS